MTFSKPASSIWVDALGMLDQAERMHRQFFRLGRGHSTGPTWEPPVDLFETPHEITVLVALPGVAPEHLKVVIDEGTLVVIGQRPMPAPAAAHIRRLEIPYGRFERRIELPAGRFEIHESVMKHGCLMLSLLKLA